MSLLPAPPHLSEGPGAKETQAKPQLGARFHPPSLSPWLSPFLVLNWRRRQGSVPLEAFPMEDK